MTMPFQHNSPEKEPRPAHVEFAGERLDVVDRVLASTERALIAMGVSLHADALEFISQESKPAVAPSENSVVDPVAHLVSENPLHPRSATNDKPELDHNTALADVYLAFEQPQKESV